MILILIPSAIWAAKPYPYSPFLVIGHVDSSLSLTVNIDDSILPIDFTSDAVKYNANPGANAAGLKIGSYNIISNESFNFYIAHTPFNLRTPMEEQDDNKDESIDYVLYVISDMSTGEFDYCYGSDGAQDPALIVEEHKSVEISREVSNGLARIVNHSLFLSLVNQSPANLRAGLYESTIYFVLESQ